MHTMLYSILATAMLAAGVLTQLVPPTFNNTPQADPDKVGALRLHNFYRGQVGVPDLTWCNNLTMEAQVAADWFAGADIPDASINFTRRSSLAENATFTIQITYISPSTPRLFGDFYQATLAFYADHTSYHGEVIPEGDFVKYSLYSKYPRPQTHSPPFSQMRTQVACTETIADNNPTSKPRWSGTAPPASEWPVPRTPRTELLSLLPTLLRATCKYRISNIRLCPAILCGFDLVG